MTKTGVIEEDSEHIMPVYAKPFMAELMSNTPRKHLEMTGCVFADIMIECTKLQEALDNVT